MKNVCIYLQVHQPYRVKRYGLFDVGHDHAYFDGNDATDLNNRRVLRKVGSKSYLPGAERLLDLLDRHPQFRFALSISGVALEQLERDAPDVIDILRLLAKSGRVEFLGETYYHSLAFFYSRSEFEQQVRLHARAIERLFEVSPRVFRNTELSYTNALSAWADERGYLGILAEGWDPVLGGRSPNHVYRPVSARRTRLLLKNYKLSDDIAFRFSSRDWSEWPLTAEKFGQWLSAAEGETVNLFMDYETFGEHQWEDTGIFDFLSTLPGELLKNPEITFMTPSGVIASLPDRGVIDVPHVTTWADTDRDLTAWLGNEMQHAAVGTLYGLEARVRAAGDAAILEDWRRLQTSDHFYYLCTKWSADGDVHAYFSPYGSPYEAYKTYMHALKDLEWRLRMHERFGHPAPAALVLSDNS